MSEFWKRTLSGAVYVGVVVASILYDAVCFASLSAVLTILAIREYNKLTHPRCWMDLCSELCALLMNLCVTWHFYLHTHASHWFGLAYIVILLIPLIGELWNKDGNPIVNWGNLLIGQMMIALPFALMSALALMDKWMMLAIFVLIWVNDSGAYCVGVLTAKKMPGGNHKMFPRVSPKKSWEGLFGGLAFTIGAAFILNRYGWFEAITKEGYELLIAGAFALIVSGFGTLGDLMESLFKRSLGVKDSGRFLPGHGGVLDRFDSILLAAPVLTSYAWLCYFLAPLL